MPHARISQVRFEALATEKDSQELQDLLRLLQAVILAKQYPTAIGETKRTNPRDPLARTTTRHGRNVQPDWARAYGGMGSRGRSVEPIGCSHYVYTKEADEG
jgi:hypothetical protein